MTTSSRSTALLPLVLAGVVINTGVAVADSINLLRPSSAAVPVILIDQAKGPWRSDDEATAIMDGECVAVTGRTREPKLVALGGVDWRAGQLAWRWEGGAEPEVIYLVCVDRPPRERGLGGGMRLSAALSWSGQPFAIAARGQRFAESQGTAPPDEGPAVMAPGDTPSPPDLPSWLSEPPLDAPLDAPIGAPVDLPIPIGSMRFPEHQPVTDDGPGASDDTPLVGLFDPPIPDANEMVPMPEPGTFLLMGTGLTAAWRMARRKRED